MAISNKVLKFDVSILGSTQVSTWRLCTKQHGVFLLLAHQRLKVPFVKRCAVAWKTRLRKLCFNPKNHKTPKNASQFTVKSYDFHTFSLPLKPHCHISAFQGSFPSTSGMLYAGIIPAGKQKPLPCTGPPWENLPSFAPLPKGHHGPTSDLPTRIRCLVVLGGRSESGTALW